MDLHGLSALILLGRPSPVGFVLSLTGPGSVVLEAGAGPLARAVEVRLADPTCLPCRSATIDLMLVDLDETPASASRRVRLAREIRRVLREDGCCVAIVSHRRRPREVRRVLKYRFTPPISKWLPLLAREGLVVHDSVLLQFEGARLAGLRQDAMVTGASVAGWTGDAAALVLAQQMDPTRRSIVGEVVHRVEEVTGAATTLEQIAVRKIGKTAAFVRNARGERYVARIARSSVAQERAARNFETLSRIRGQTTYPAGLRALLPPPLLHTVVGGYAVYVEECLAGSSRKVAQDAPLGWEPHALDFVVSLHRLSARRAILDDEVYDRLIEAPLSMIATHLSDKHRGTLRALATLLRARLYGAALPLVRSHGDFTNENCLYDAGGRLCGVVDWELSSDESLPLLDLLQLLDIAGDSSASRRWRRADVILDAAEGRGPLTSASELTQYVAALGIAKSVVPMLMLMHWVDHLSQRVAHRITDQVWTERRLHQPLDRLAAVVASLGV